VPKEEEPYKKQPRPSYELPNKVYELKELFVIPIDSKYDIDNLYPSTDRVHMWNIFAIGSDKSYIFVRANDDPCEVFKTSLKENNHAMSDSTNSLLRFMDDTWKHVLDGHSLHVYLFLIHTLYLVSAFPIVNGRQNVIGGMMFMRRVSSLPVQTLPEGAMQLTIKHRYPGDINAGLITKVTENGEQYHIDHRKIFNDEEDTHFLTTDIDRTYETLNQKRSRDIVDAAAATAARGAVAIGSQRDGSRVPIAHRLA
jgi:hypothetical protein